MGQRYHSVVFIFLLWEAGDIIWNERVSRDNNMTGRVSMCGRWPLSGWDKGEEVMVEGWSGKKEKVFQLSPLSFSSLPLMFYLFIYLFLDLSSSVFVSPPWCIFGVVVFSSLLSTQHCCKCRRSKGVKKSVCPFAVNILQVTVNPLWLCSVA